MTDCLRCRGEGVVGQVTRSTCPSCDGSRRTPGGQLVAKVTYHEPESDRRDPWYWDVRREGAPDPITYGWAATEEQAEAKAAAALSLAEVAS